MGCERIDWSQAACAGLTGELFFDDEKTEVARQICLGCPLRSDCLSEAIQDDDGFGMRGGLTADERRYLSAARVPKGKLVVIACGRCDEPVSWRLSPIPASGRRAGPGRFALLDDVLVVAGDDLRRPLVEDSLRCSCGQIAGWRVDGSTDVGLELARTTVRSPGARRQVPMAA